jgi:hypothetical protein
MTGVQVRPGYPAPCGATRSPLGRGPNRALANHLAVGDRRGVQRWDPRNEANCFCCDASPEVTTSAARTACASGPPRVRRRPAVSWMPAGRMGCGGPMRPMRPVLPGARLPDEDSYLLWLPPASRDFTP